MPTGPIFPSDPSGWGWQFQTEEPPIAGAPSNGKIVSLSFSPPSATISFDGVDGAAGYRIYRSTSPAEVGTLITLTDIPQPGADPWTFQYTDNTVIDSTVYWYRAFAIDLEGHASFPSSGLRVFVSENSSTLLEDIRNILVEAGIVGGSTGWVIGRAFMPPAPDKIVVLYETPGSAPDITKDPSVSKAYDEPGFQVRIRGTKFKYQETRAKLQEVFLALHQNEPAVTSGEDYIFIYAVSSGPLPMGKDSNDRDELVWNFRVMRER